MNEDLILFHGTNVFFDRVDLDHSKDKRDFGKGFYTTTFKEQAASWAENMYIRYGGEGMYIMSFKLHIPPNLKVKTYCGLTKEWLSMIKNNRLYGGIQHDYDIVIGPMADDDTMRTVALYVAGIYTEEMAIEKLRSFEPHNQVSIHTLKALDCLSFVGRV